MDIQSNSSNILIFRYTDFRKFLKDALQEWKERDSRVSHRWVAQRLKIRSPGWLGDVLGGRRNLKREQSQALASLLSLPPREEMFFEYLVEYGQCTTIEGKQRAYQKLMSFQEIPRDLVGQDRDEYFASWIHAAVRESLLIRPFRGDYARLGASLVPPIGEKEIRKSISLLERLGMIKKFAGSEWRPTTEHVKMHPDFAPMQYASYVRSAMEIGREAMERLRKEERDISTVCATLSVDAFAELRDEISALRKKMIVLSQKENRLFWDAVPGDSRRVYQLLVELFPVTASEESAGEAKA